MYLYLCAEYILEMHWKERKKNEVKCRNFICNSKADKISLVYQRMKQKKMNEQNEKKNRLAIKSGNGQKHPRDLCEKAREIMVGRFMEKVFSFESGVERK